MKKTIENAFLITHSQKKAIFLRIYYNIMRPKSMWRERVFVDNRSITLRCLFGATDV